jgi:hypothetical protein
MLSLLVALSLERQAKDDKKLQGFAARIRKWSMEALGTIKVLAPVPMSWSEIQRHKLNGLINTLNIDQGPLGLAVVLEVSLSTVEDVLDSVPAKYRTSWNWLQCALQSLLNYGDPNREGAEGGLEAYEKVMAFMTGETGQKEPEPKPYIVHDRFLVIARSRPEAKNAVLKELGIVASKVQGLPLDAKCVDEQGRDAGTYGDAVKLATRIPEVLGKAA